MIRILLLLRCWRFCFRVSFKIICFFENSYWFPQTANESHTSPRRYACIICFIMLMVNFFTIKNAIFDPYKTRFQIAFLAIYKTLSRITTGFVFYVFFVFFIKSVYIYMRPSHTRRTANRAKNVHQFYWIPREYYLFLRRSVFPSLCVHATSLGWNYSDVFTCSEHLFLNFPMLFLFFFEICDECEPFDINSFDSRWRHVKYNNPNDLKH